MEKNPWCSVNILFVKDNNVENVEDLEIQYVYISKYTRQKQTIILMIKNVEALYNIAVTKLSSLFRDITSKHNGDFYFLNCLNSFKTKEKDLKS